jgi:predicted RecB family nuclease
MKNLTIIPGVGKSIASDLWHIGIKKVDDLKGQDPEELYELSNRFAGKTQDRCLLYVFRCAVYYAETPEDAQDPEKLKWWNWKDGKY